MSPWIRIVAVAAGALTLLGVTASPAASTRAPDPTIDAAYRVRDIAIPAVAPTSVAVTARRRLIPRPTPARPRRRAIKPLIRRANAQLAATPCEQVIAGIVWPARWRATCAGPRAGVLGLTSPTGVTTLYVRAGETTAFLRIVALHEAGHAWDLSHLTPAKIAAWCARRGCTSTRFFAGGESGAGWSQPAGAEDWAASWDACHGGSYHRSYLGLGPPTGAECALQNALVRYPRG